MLFYRLRKCISPSQPFKWSLTPLPQSQIEIYIVSVLYFLYTIVNFLNIYLSFENALQKIHPA